TSRALSANPLRLPGGRPRGPDWGRERRGLRLDRGDLQPRARRDSSILRGRPGWRVVREPDRGCDDGRGRRGAAVWRLEDVRYLGEVRRWPLLSPAVPPGEGPVRVHVSRQ